MSRFISAERRTIILQMLRSDIDSNLDGLLVLNPG